jgi:hypothetical protein
VRGEGGVPLLIFKDYEWRDALGRQMRGYNKNNKLYAFWLDPSPPPSPRWRGAREIFDLLQSLRVRGKKVIF